MTNASLDISGKIDDVVAGALARVKAAADSLGLSFFIIGALARDILLKHFYGLQPQRATLDLDLGVSVATWGDLSNLKNALIKTHNFDETSQMQRLQFRRLRVDFVPFGPIAGPAHKIRWPPDEALQMSTAGFEEAFRSSHLVRVSSSPDVIVCVCSLPGLVILKLISWHERKHERRRDAEDVFEIMEKYESAGNFDRLFSEESEMLQNEGFETKKAVIRLLGRDVAKIASPYTRQLILSILEEATREDSSPRLSVDMALGVSTADVDLDDIGTKISKLRQGFEDVIGNT